ncbi:beta-hexosaminidase [Betaproteobacteria bacterium]|nr:beta-hexosaminidase [Betaproteobacteria bacterium]
MNAYLSYLSHLSPLFHVTGLVKKIQALLIWGALLVAGGVACYLKHPLLYGWRRAETPVLLGLAVVAGWLTWRALRARPTWTGRIEPGLRLMACLMVGGLVVAQEGRFRWQQYQVEQAGAAMKIIGRHFVVGFRDFAEVAPLAERGLIGGIYLTRRNLAGQDAASLRQHIDALQDLRRRAGLAPLFVMADQEGGEVAHLSPLIERLPALSTLVAQGREGLEERAYAQGARQGRDMAALGINMNLAPVVDLKPAEKGHWLNLHTLIERRAIAADPGVVTTVASAYGAGLQASGILPTVKHFPGLGRVQADTHLAKASLTLDAAKQSSDWQPFREVTARTGAAMMLAHVCLTDIDPEFPASLSRKLVTGVLRKSGDAGWNYQGLLITDDLNMLAVYQDGIGRAASRALDAGVDLVLVSYDPDQYYRALHEAATSWRNGGIDSLREIESAMRLQAYWQERGRKEAPVSYAKLRRN